MKILYKNRGYGGGAPRSLLEYIKIAKKYGIDVVSVGEHDYPPLDYKRANIKLIDFPIFKIKRPIKSFYLLVKYINIIKQEKPDLIHAITQDNCYFHTVIANTTNIPIIYTIPGGVVSSITAEIMKEQNLLVFSEENKLDLINYGYKNDQITVLSNRIDTNKSNNEYNSHYKDLVKNDKKLRFLLISRMSDDKINSIKYIIEVVKKLNLDNFNVELDILGNGKHYDVIKNVTDEINRRFKKDIINLHGFKHNVYDYIRQSHIVFGKGRSVLDGIMNCRLAYVVSENYSFTHCNIDTFENLRTYNFTGRNAEQTDTYQDLVNMVTSLLKSSIDLNYLKDLKEIAREYYDIKYAEKKVLKLYKSINSNKINLNPSFFRLLKEYVCLYIKLFKTRKNKFTKA